MSEKSDETFVLLDYDGESFIVWLLKKMFENFTPLSPTRAKSSEGGRPAGMHYGGRKKMT